MDDGAEQDRIAARTIARVALAIVGILVTALLLLSGLAYYDRLSHPASKAVYPIPPLPRIDAAPQRELETYLAEQRARLDGYAWVDRGRGIAHIPIERAMALYAREAGGKKAEQ